MTGTDRTAGRGGWPVTLVAGVSLIALLELMLAFDVLARGGGIVPDAPLPPATGVLGTVARLAATDMTPLAWTGFLLVADGLLVRSGGSPVRRRPRRFALCWAASIPIWLFFDGVNFGFMQAWDYHGLPAATAHRLAAYALSFGAICPAMFLAAEIVRRRIARPVRWRPLALPSPLPAGLAGLGALCLVFPVAVAAPIGNLTLWLGPALLLDPVNRALGAPSLLRDWEQGRYGRTLSLMAGGLVCGLLWEFWNYWAVAKWTYDLPFLGPLEAIRYFEMPLPGLGGFLPFAASCWAMFQTVALLADRLGLRLEPQPPDAVL